MHRQTPFLVLNTACEHISRACIPNTGSLFTLDRGWQTIGTRDINSTRQNFDHVDEYKKQRMYEVVI